jgi:hypothetical protein
VLQFRTTRRIKGSISDCFNDALNCLDFLRIIAQFAYLFLVFGKENNSKLEGELFGLILIISWISLLQYLRVIQQFRFLTFLIIQCAKEILPFMSIWLILLFGFSQALFWRIEYSFDGEQT